MDFDISVEKDFDCGGFEDVMAFLISIYIKILLVGLRIFPL